MGGRTAHVTNLDMAVEVFAGSYEHCVEVEESGLAHINNRRVTKVLTEAGARDLAFQRFDYDPATQDIKVKQVVVHRADGSVEVVDLAGLVDVIAPAWAIYWGACTQQSSP